MYESDPFFGEHPSPMLKDAYQGYQGCIPEDAKVIFLGKDPNYHRNIEKWPVINEMLAYLRQGIGYYIDNPNILPFRHHPFLSPNYRNPCSPRQKDGYRYHTMFRRVFGSFGKGGVFENAQDAIDYRNCSAKISFVELVGTPTFGMIQGNNHDMVAEAKREFNRMLFGVHNQSHLQRIAELIFNSRGKTIFASTGVYKLLRVNQKRLFGINQDKLTAPFPNDASQIVSLYENTLGSRIISVLHFAAAIKEDYFTQLKDAIQGTL